MFIEKGSPWENGYIFACLTDMLEAVLLLLKARVAENMVFAAGANLVDVETSTEFFGHSIVLKPKPSSVAYQVYAGPASRKKEELISASLDLSLVDQFGFSQMRHPECYGALTTVNP